MADSKIDVRNKDIHDEDDIRELVLSPKSLGALRRAGIKTVGQLSKTSEKTIGGLSDISSKEVGEIRQQLMRAGKYNPPTGA